MLILCFGLDSGIRESKAERSGLGCCCSLGCCGICAAELNAFQPELFPNVWLLDMVLPFEEEEFPKLLLKFVDIPLLYDWLLLILKTK